VAAGPDPAGRDLGEGVVIQGGGPVRSRRWDRGPETERDRRFFDQRERGWTGWIDQDGYPVIDGVVLGDDPLVQVVSVRDADPAQVCAGPLVGSARAAIGPDTTNGTTRSDGNEVLEGQIMDMTPYGGPGGDLAFSAAGELPETDAELLGILAAVTRAIAAAGEQLTQLHEDLTTVTRVDPGSVAQLEHLAELLTEASGVASGMAHQFVERYEQVREFVAGGGVLPRDGNFITGEEAA
jgi:ABC-type transporter Mla MlaB component